MAPFTLGVIPTLSVLTGSSMITGGSMVAGFLVVLAVVRGGDLVLAVEAAQEDHTDHNREQGGDESGVLVDAAVLGVLAVSAHG